MKDAVLLTGGAGFIGSHLLRDLLCRGERVVVLDNFDPYYLPSIKRSNLTEACSDIPAGTCQVIEGDIRNASIYSGAVPEAGPYHSIIHLAAQTGVRPSLGNPGLYMDVNVNGTALLYV